MQRRKSTADIGFTLLEILVAIFLFAILISAVFASFRAIHDSATALQQDDRYYETAQAALSRMQCDLESIFITVPARYKPPGFNEPADAYRVFGESTSSENRDFSTLRFTSLSHLPMNGDTNEGVAQIVYYVHQSEPNLFALRRADQLWPYETIETNHNNPILCENVQSLAFKFLNESGEYRDAWDSDSADYDYATPRAIEIVLTVGDDTHSLTMKTVADLHVYRDPIAAAQ
jgi:general secretion pathway protein J